MKRIIMLGIVLVTMFVSLGGCFWGPEGRDRGDRGGGYDRGEGGGVKLARSMDEVKKYASEILGMS